MVSLVARPYPPCAQLTAIPMAGRFEDTLPAATARAGRKLLLFMGSSLGNFTDTEALAFFRRVASHMRSSDRFLVGVDTPHSPHKPAQTLERAYNDTRGVTAAFTINALRHINRTAALDFDWRHGWRHEARYVPHEAAVVTTLIALGEQTIRDTSPTGGARILRTFADGARRLPFACRAARAARAFHAVRAVRAAPVRSTACLTAQAHKERSRSRVPDR